MFDLLGLAAMLATLLNTDVTSAGWLLGASLTMVMVVVGMILSSQLEATSPVPIFMLTGTGLGLSTVFGWFPVWMAFFVFVFGLMSVMGLMAGRGSE